ncbi:thiamine pyrophosphate-binding protein [Pinisolibacter sp. B13]|nr:thiamine pyrophosphate-binding protein [Pinisolibacter aquiterrae]
MGETKAARLVAETLAANGVARVFTVASAGSGAAIDALHAHAIEVVAAALETSAVVMAEATARLTGRPGVVVVSGDCGAALAVAGLRLAAHEATPLILLVDGIEGGATGPLRDLFASSAKWVAEIDGPDGSVAMVTRAFTIAASGRPGPVVVLLPTALAEGLASAPRAIRPAPIVETHPGAASMWDLQKRLWAAKRPLALLGGSRWSEKAYRQFARFADKFDLPVACAFGRQALFDQLDPHYVGDVGPAGDPALAARIDAADLLLIVGADVASGTDRATAPEDGSSRTLVHVHASAEDLGGAMPPDLAIHASPSAFAAAAEGLEPPPAGVAWAAWREAARAEHVAWSESQPADAGAVRMAGVIDHLRAALPPETILVGDASPASLRLQRHWRFRRFATQLTTTFGAIGRGLPAGIAAGLALPGRPVVVATGAGDVLRTLSELATACENGVAPIVLLFDDGERPPSPTDVAAIARIYGAFAAAVETAEAFAPAFEAARVCGGPSLLHIRLDGTASPPRTAPTRIPEAAARPG